MKIHSIYIGRVLSTDDPMKIGRIKVSLPIWEGIPEEQLPYIYPLFSYNDVIAKDFGIKIGSMDVPLKNSYVVVIFLDKLETHGFYIGEAFFPEFSYYIQEEEFIAKEFKGNYPEIAYKRLSIDTITAYNKRLPFEGVLLNPFFYVQAKPIYKKDKLEKYSLKVVNPKGNVQVKTSNMGIVCTSMVIQVGAEVDDKSLSGYSDQFDDYYYQKVPDDLNKEPEDDGSFVLIDEEGDPVEENLQKSGLADKGIRGAKDKLDKLKGKIPKTEIPIPQIPEIPIPTIDVPIPSVDNYLNKLNEFVKVPAIDLDYQLEFPFFSFDGIQFPNVEFPSFLSGGLQEKQVSYVSPRTKKMYTSQKDELNDSQPSLVIEGDVLIKGNIIVDRNLQVKQGVLVGDNLEFGGDIDVKGNIKVGKKVIVKEEVKCSDLISGEQQISFNTHTHVSGAPGSDTTPPKKTTY